MGYEQGKCKSIKNCVAHGTGPITTAPHHTSGVRNSSSTSLVSNTTCDILEPYCSLRSPSHALDGLRDVCVLWDTSCHGNNASAPHNYWKEHLATITHNTCFYNYAPKCVTSNPSGRQSAFAGMKNWMRGSQCFKNNPLISEDPNHSMEYDQSEFLNTTCCGDQCEIVADKVDVYYWPDPHADSSCLSIVGNDVSYVADGATTDASSNTYWGCTIYGTGLGNYANESSTIFTTATLSSVAGISYKAYLINPWDPSQCGNRSAVVPLKETSATSSAGITAQLRPRAHSLIVASSGVSTTVLGNYTL